MKNKRIKRKENRDLMEYLHSKYIEKDVTTLDDWYPNFPGNKVGVTLSMSFFEEFRVVLIVGGADDTYVRKEYTTSKLEEAETVYDVWKETIYDKLKKDITRDQLFLMGFEWG